VEQGQDEREGEVTLYVIPAFAPRAMTFHSATSEG
jgi:hypothetical protein